MNRKDSDDADFAVYRHFDFLADSRFLHGLLS
jgi:hypothetical protein